VPFKELLKLPRTKSIVSIENVVASATIDQKLDLIDIKKKFPAVEYNPKKFPGAIFKLKSPKTAILLFTTGKMVCTGCKSTSDVFRAVHYIHTTLEEKELMYYD